MAQNIFSNKLIQRILATVPNVNPATVIGAGATALRNALTPAQLTLVLRAFMDSLKDAYIVPIALTGVAFFLAFALDRNMRIKGGIKMAGLA
jgi:hypothetical protein